MTLIQGDRQNPARYVGILRRDTETGEVVDTRGVHFKLIRNERDPLAAKADKYLLSTVEEGAFSS